MKTDGYTKIAGVCVWVCSLGLWLWLGQVLTAAVSRSDVIGVAIGAFVAAFAFVAWIRFTRSLWSALR